LPPVRSPSYGEVMSLRTRTGSLVAAALGGILLLVVTAGGSAGSTTGAGNPESREPEPDWYSKMEEGSEPLLDLTKQVAADFDYWSHRGVEIQSVHPDAKRGVVVIGAVNPDAVRTLLKQHYRDVSLAKITVEQGESGTPLR
jgi:hypothetical protein